jgi:hypothetical protein
VSTSMPKIGVSDYAVRQHEPGSLLPLTAATAARYWQRKDWLNSPVPQVHTICAPLTIVSSPAPDTAYEKAAAAPAERLGDDQRPFRREAETVGTGQGRQRRRAAEVNTAPIATTAYRAGYPAAAPNR